MPVPVFMFELNSPYAYLAAERVDQVLGDDVTWRPIFFGALLRAQGRVPWSLRPGEREPGMREVERRAAARGLPAVAWPQGWPLETFSVPALRAATWALDEDRDAGRALTLALFRAMFVQGRPLSDFQTVRAAAESVGLDAEEVADVVERQAVKDALRAHTDAAIAAGVPGVPTVVVDDRMFWGDDRLDEAAAALSGAT